jgi:Mg/Co/Ni transporter MgtE
MTPGIVYVFEDQDLEEAARLMKERQLRRLVVLDRNKKLVGILSLGDIAADTKDEELSGEVLEKISEPSEPARRRPRDV